VLQKFELAGSVLAAYNSSKLQREYLSTSGAAFQPEIRTSPVLTSIMAIVGTGVDICEVYILSRRLFVKGGRQAQIR